MKRMMTLLVIASLFPVQSCILEDRTDCPTYLTLEFPSVPKEVALIHLSSNMRTGRYIMTQCTERIMPRAANCRSAREDSA